MIRQFLLSIGLALFASGAVVAQDAFVTDGVSLDNILIGKSNMEDVIAEYGSDYRLITHYKYSFQMAYEKLGVSFYFCQADPLKEIFSIQMQKPFRVMTSKGIELGKSTFEDVSRIYGNSRRGIRFYPEEREYKKETKDESKSKEKTKKKSNVFLKEPRKLVLDEEQVKKSKVVRRIQLFEVDGLRQCHIKFKEKKK